MLLPAKFYSRPPIAHRIFFKITLSLLLFCAPELALAEFRLVPTIIVSEEYTDNVEETVSNKRNEYITRTQPGFSLIYNAARAELNIPYSFDFRHYANGTRSDEYTHNLVSYGKLALVENLFFLEASDTYRRVSLDVSRDNTSESLYLNQSDQNVASVTPYFILRLGSNSSIKTGYRYTNTWYREPTGIDKNEHSAYVDASHEVLPGFSFTWGYSYFNVKATDQQYQRHNAFGGFRYEYAPQSFVFGQGGNTWESFDNGISVNNIFWNAGITHEFPLVIATLETRVQYTEDPLRSSIKETLYSGRLTKILDRGRIELSGAYSEFEIVETGVIDRKRASVGVSASYEIINSITLSLQTLGERFSRRVESDYPYRLTGNVGLNYIFNNNLSLLISYSYITNRDSISDTAASNDTNRVILQLTKSFN